jgi:hypothetical protein
LRIELRQLATFFQVSSLLRRYFRFRRTHYPSWIRQLILMLAASNDTSEEFACYLRAGSHLVIAGSKHEILQEQCPSIGLASFQEDDNASSGMTSLLVTPMAIWLPQSAVRSIFLNRRKSNQ